jgi:transglutaminase-like putative cysteine protease
LGLGGAPSPGGGRAGAARRGVALALHAAVLALAAMIFAWPVALPIGVGGAALGAALGTALAERLTQARFRLVFVALSALGAGAVLGGVGRLFAGEAALAAAVGPENAMRVEELASYAALALGGAGVLRALALRYRAALAIEGSIVVLAVAVTVAAHRDGMIARPLEISDWFWSQGVDPVVAFLAIGVAAAVLLAGILAHGRSIGRTLVQLSIVLFLGIFLASTIHGRDPDEKRDVLGRSGKDGKDADREKAQREAAERRGGAAGQGEGGGGGGQGQRNQDPYGENNDMRRPPEGRQENRPTAVVVFHRGVTPGNGVFYFRQSAFSQWNGVRLVASSSGEVDADARVPVPFEKVEVPVPVVEAEGRELVATDVAWLQDHQRFFGLVDTVETEPLANPDPARFRRAYRTVSSVVTSGYDELVELSPGSRDWSDDVWRLYTETPKDPRYAKLATQLRDELKAEYQTDPIALAMAVKGHLEESATYTFDVNYDGAEDPTAAFLFSPERRGYCVHLAHATAFLLRALGLPTRVSVGYAVVSSNLGGGSSLLVKGNDAHAWAELYLDGRGWVPIEVTPEKSEVKPQEFAERDLQQMLGEMARKEGRSAREQTTPFPWLAILRSIRDAIPWVVLALLAVAYATKGWRLLAPGFAARRHQPRTAYRAALDRLSAVGLVRRPGESPERFARRIAELAPSLTPLTHAHSGFALGSARARRLEDPVVPLATALGREVRARVPRWRWLLGLLNPINWMWSR